ncbi:MAG: hypothetical protein ACYC6M_04975 [Terriglobales bacterium]
MRLATRRYGAMIQSGILGPTGSPAVQSLGPSGGGPLAPLMSFIPVQATSGSIWPWVLVGGAVLGVGYVVLRRRKTA